MRGTNCHRPFVIAAFVLMFLTQYKTCAQLRVQYTQYMFNGVLINPAYAGADGPLSLTFVQRSQWTGVDGAPSTQSLAAHSLFKTRQTGVGFVLVNDRIGVHQNLNALANYAYHLPVGDDRFLSFGLQAGVLHRKSDYLSIIGDASNDPHLRDPLIQYTGLDVGAGIYYRSNTFHFGISVPELLGAKLKVNDSLTLQLSNASYLMFSKYRLTLNETMHLEPGVLLKYLPGLPFSADVNLNVIFHEALTTGVSYRTKESLDFLLKAQVTQQLQFGYAYDHPVGDVARISGGSHEIMVQYLFRYIRSGIPSPR